MFFLIPALTAFVITILITPVIIRIAEKYGLVDNPKLRPHPAHIQNRIIPRAGGLACFFGIILPILIFLPLEKHLLGIILGMLLLLIIGIADDKLKNLSPFSRLTVQIFASLIVVASGVGISYFTNPFGGIIRLDGIVYTLSFLGIHNIILLADLVAVLWIVWTVNMVNWANGVDGQTPGFMAVAFFILGFYSFGLSLNGDQNQYWIAVLAFISGGTALGFLPFNWHPARIFLGFSGTMILGFMLAVLSILSGAKLAVALLVLLLPAVDSIYTGVRRILSRKSPFYGDRNHLHHLLLKRGWTHQQISLFYITTCAILGMLAINLSSSGKLFAILGISTLIIGSLLWLTFFGNSSEHSDPGNG